MNLSQQIPNIEKELDLVVIAGPTACGKSKLAMNLASEHNGAIINADALQIYSDNPILSAQPSPQDQLEITHHLYGFHEGKEAFCVMQWLDFAKAAITKIQKIGKLPIICGGTGFYIKSLLEGKMDEVPPIPEPLRQAIRQRAKEQGAKNLWQELNTHDPIMAKRLHPNDQQRIARALEVFLATGKSLNDWQIGQKATIKPYNSYLILIDPPRPQLWHRQQQRVDEMLKAGALEEVKNVMAQQHLYGSQFLNTIGMLEFMNYLSGKSDLDSTKEQIFIATRQYSKRQSTWFRHQFHEDIKINTLYL